MAEPVLNPFKKLQEFLDRLMGRDPRTPIGGISREQTITLPDGSTIDITLEEQALQGRALSNRLNAWASYLRQQGLTADQIQTIFQNLDPDTEHFLPLPPRQFTTGDPPAEQPETGAGDPVNAPGASPPDKGTPAGPDRGDRRPPKIPVPEPEGPTDPREPVPGGSPAEEEEEKEEEEKEEEEKEEVPDNAKKDKVKKELILDHKNKKHLPLRPEFILPKVSMVEETDEQTIRDWLEFSTYEDGNIFQPDIELTSSILTNKFHPDFSMRRFDATTYRGLNKHFYDMNGKRKIKEGADLSEFLKSETVDWYEVYDTEEEKIIRTTNDIGDIPLTEPKFF